MKAVEMFAVALSVLSLLLLPSAAGATSIFDCQYQITTLLATTTTATFLGNNARKDKDSVVGKLVEALEKLGALKFGDAIQKLDDYRGKVLQLAAASKLDPNQASSLVGAADSGITCIQDLMNQSGTTSS